MLLGAALGSSTVTAVPSATGAYQQVHTPLVNDFPPSYTIQKGIPLLGGAVQAETFLGAVCESAEIKASNSGLVTLDTEWTAREVRTDVGYAAPSYPTGLDIFSFVHGSIVIGGTLTLPTTTTPTTGGTTVANIREASVKWSNKLDSNGWNLGGAGKRSRRPALGMAEIGGSLTAEYDSNTLRDAYLNQTPLAMVLAFTHTSLIGTGTPVAPLLQVTIPMVYLEGDVPKANGGDVVTQSIPFTGLDNLAAGAKPIYVVYRSTDAAI